ncbi:MAG: GNAT family N-acetyltransferase [Bacteroidota bacterium]|nr:GNAT family N-acetyltransferase [Bacteroidota bacterium]
MKIVIVPFDADTYPAIVKLRLEVLRQPINLKFTKQQLDKERGQLAVCLLSNGDVPNEENLVACSMLLPLNAKELKLRQMAVKVDLQTQGYGTQLLQAIEQYAVEHHYEKLSMHARAYTQEFYTKNGYETDNNLGGFSEVGIPHYRMYKVL